MFVTVAICTWDRCALLLQTLEQMTKLVVPPELEWELLVVNNNCSDTTDQVIQLFSNRLPIRCLFEPKPGLSHARNLAVSEAKGDYTVWTDDDVFVDEAWIIEYCAAFKRWPEAAIFGGPVQPYFAGRPPQWLLQILPRVGGAYALRDLGDKPVPLTHHLVPFGANFAIRTKDQSQFRYDPYLGRRPGSMLVGEETTVIREMLAAGAHGRWVPRARVWHYIPKERQTTRYLRAFFRAYGEGLKHQTPLSGKRRLFGRPLWLWRQAIEGETRYRLSRLFCKPEVWVEDLKLSAQSWGQLLSVR